MRLITMFFLVAWGTTGAADPAATPRLVEKPGTFETLINPACSHCKDEAKRRALDLKPNDQVLCWTRGYSEGGTIPHRFFLAPYRVISDSYGVFVYDPDAGYSRGFAPSYDFRFHGWRNGVMVMKHKDGTLYSCLTGVAFDGPKKGMRLKSVPTLVSDWGVWLEKYPNAVAYHMFDKYQPSDLPTTENPDSVKSRGTLDPRLKADVEILGVWTDQVSRAYPVTAIEQSGLISDKLGDDSIVVLWEPQTKTASCYKPVASQPGKFKAPAPDATGESKVDEGTPLPAGALLVKPRSVTLARAMNGAAGRFQDAETSSLWDVAGRCVEGKLKGWTLEWVDSVQVKWSAWAAEYPQTTLYADSKPATPDGANKKVKEVAGTAEFLRLLPKPFAIVRGVDAARGSITLRLEGETADTTWPLEPDAEVKVGTWWGRLEQFQPGDRVWVWLKLDRKKKPVSIVMLADAVSEFDIHSSLEKVDSPPFTNVQIETKREKQKDWLRKRWIDVGLPGTLTFHHVFSGELELALDHEAMRWGRSLKSGDIVHLTVDPPIKAVVKSAAPWRERTVLRLVVGELESSELKIGQRLAVKMTPLSEADENSVYPPGIGRSRSTMERVEWFLASMYCVCGVGKDTCTGMFYTLASCNPNGCGAPDATRTQIKAMIEKGMPDREIWDAMAKERGSSMARPHLRK